jgi:hypothetical protein
LPYCADEWSLGRQLQQTASHPFVNLNTLVPLHN